MAYTQKDLDSIKRAIATGAVSATVDGRLVTFRSLADMIAVRNMIESELRGTAVRKPRARYSVATFSDD